MKANYDGGGAANTRTRVANAAITVGNFVTAVLSTGKVGPRVTSASAAAPTLGMALSPATANGNLIEVAEANPGVVFTIPIYDDGTAYTACAAAAIAAAATNANKKYCGQVGFAGYLGAYFGMVVSGGVAYLNLADKSYDELHLRDVEWDSTSGRWLAKVTLVPAIDQTRVEWTG